MAPMIWFIWPLRVSILPKDPYTAHVRTLVPKTIPGMVFGTRVLKRAVYGPFGIRSRDYGLR